MGPTYTVKFPHGTGCGIPGLFFSTYETTEETRPTINWTEQKQRSDPSRTEFEIFMPAYMSASCNPRYIPKSSVQALAHIMDNCGLIRGKLLPSYFTQTLILHQTIYLTNTPANFSAQEQRSVSILKSIRLLSVVGM